MPARLMPSFCAQQIKSPTSYPPMNGSGFCADCRTGVHRKARGTPVNQTTENVAVETTTEPVAGTLLTVTVWFPFARDVNASGLAVATLPPT